MSPPRSLVMLSGRAMSGACRALNRRVDRHGAVRLAPTLMVMRGFVDIHSHMVPSGDDGVRSVDEAVELVLEAGPRRAAVADASPAAVGRPPVYRGGGPRAATGPGQIPGRPGGGGRFPG